MRIAQTGVAREKRKTPQGVGDGNNVFTSFDYKLFQFLRFAQQAGCSFSQIASVIAASFFEVGIGAGNKNQPLDACQKAAKPRSQTSVVVCSKGLGCFPTSKKQQFPASPGTAVWSLCIYEGTACYNMFDPENSVALVMLFSGSNLSYNEEVIGLTGHCLS